MKFARQQGSNISIRAFTFFIYSHQVLSVYRSQTILRIMMRYLVQMKSLSACHAGPFRHASCCFSFICLLRLFFLASKVLIYLVDTCLHLDSKKIFEVALEMSHARYCTIHCYHALPSCRKGLDVCCSCNI